ncbi:MAG: hypothetical protein KIH69_010870 [Anaerolineae bacterium]|nr:hypothetical protein [Anaerolineae bacterium]
MDYSSRHSAVYFVKKAKQRRHNCDQPMHSEAEQADGRADHCPNQ